MGLEVAGAVDARRSMRFGLATAAAAALATGAAAKGVAEGGEDGAA